MGDLKPTDFIGLRSGSQITKGRGSGHSSRIRVPAHCNSRIWSGDHSFAPQVNGYLVNSLAPIQSV